MTTGTRVDLKAIVRALGLGEKAKLTAGADEWTTQAVPRAGIPAVKLSDGPAGARGATVGTVSITPSACIPCATALGATWDPGLVARAAAVVARQALQKGARVLLAPTVNLHRHPLSGLRRRRAHPAGMLPAALRIRSAPRRCVVPDGPARSFGSALATAVRQGP
jgi:beta-glucosidase